MFVPARARAFEHLSLQVGIGIGIDLMLHWIGWRERAGGGGVANKVSFQIRALSDENICLALDQCQMLNAQMLNANTGTTPS